MLLQKLSQERDRRSSIASTDEEDALDKANVRLQQAMLRRDDLLGRIRVGQGHFGCHGDFAVAIVTCGCHGDLQLPLLPVVAMQYL